VAGFYPIKDGKLLINGVPVPEKDLSRLRLHMGDGLQALDIFEGTIYDNISLGRPHISEKEVEEILIQTGIRDYMIERNIEFDTLLNPAGKGISAGLQNRIILARTFCGNPGLVLFEDEVVPLRARVREEILNFIFNPEKDITMLASTNRIDFAKRCDWVVWIDKGRIERSGKPDEVIPTIPTELLF
jgi:ATP-binding cassette subfamily B protein